MREREDLHWERQIHSSPGEPGCARLAFPRESPEWAGDRQKGMKLGTAGCGSKRSKVLFSFKGCWRDLLCKRPQGLCGGAHIQIPVLERAEEVKLRVLGQPVQ